MCNRHIKSLTNPSKGHILSVRTQLLLGQIMLERPRRGAWSLILGGLSLFLLVSILSRSQVVCFVMFPIELKLKSLPFIKNTRSRPGVIVVWLLEDTLVVPWELQQTH